MFTAQRSPTESLHGSSRSLRRRSYRFLKFRIPRVRFVVIALAKDSHLWTDTFDRKLTDVFGVESEIAKRIAESLQAKLTGREERASAVKPTNNPEAYDAYLRGAYDDRSRRFR
jgi:hypothetical protein